MFSIEVVRLVVVVICESYQFTAWMFLSLMLFSYFLCCDAFIPKGQSRILSGTRFSLSFFFFSFFP